MHGTRPCGGSASVTPAAVVSREDAGTDGYILELRPEVSLGPIGPSQFFMLSLPDRCDPLLPRPFSVYRLAGENLKFLVKLQGPATRAYRSLPPGAEIILTGPLGRPWPDPEPDDRLVLVAGGVGLAPFPLAIDRAAACGIPAERIRLFFGARSAGGLYDLERLRASGTDVRTITEDGTCGTTGRVTDLLSQEFESGLLDGKETFFVCGPDPMMVAVRALLDERGCDAWFSLETYMACGIGVCNGCAVPVRPEEHGGWPYAKACLEGPVFSSRVLAPEALEVHG